MSFYKELRKIRSVTLRFLKHIVEGEDLEDKLQEKHRLYTKSALLFT